MGCSSSNLIVKNDEFTNKTNFKKEELIECYDNQNNRILNKTENELKKETIFIQDKNSNVNIRIDNENKQETIHVQNKKLSNLKGNIKNQELKKVKFNIDNKTFSVEENSNNKKGSIENLENYDLIHKFLNRPRIQKYMSIFFSINYLDDSLTEHYAGLYEEISDEIHKLFDRFEIILEIPRENFTVDVISYKLVCEPSSSLSLDLLIPLFFIELSIYPKSFIKKSGIKKLVLIESLEFSTSQYSQYRAACPEYGKTKAMYYCTKERSIDYIRQVLHHEFFHYFDFTHDLTFDDPIWRTFNNSNFQYGSGGAYEREWKPLDPDSQGFINHYSTTAIEEDKAEIYQYFINNPTLALSNPDPIVKQKVDYTYKWLSEYDPEGIGKGFMYNLIDFRKKFILNI